MSKSMSKDTRMVAPSVLSADFGNLERDIEMLNQSDCDWIHCDIMDGMFVPNISFGMPVLKAINAVAKKPMDVHLMIHDPSRYVEAFASVGADILTVHYEGNYHLDRVLHQIRDAGMRPAVCLNPGSSVTVIRDVLHIVDMVLLMSVNPGFGGQKFIANTVDKVRQLSAMREEMGLDFLIEIDGGVNGGNAGELYEAGANVLVAGSYVFKHKDPFDAIRTIKSAKS